MLCAQLHSALMHCLAPRPHRVRCVQLRSLQSSACLHQGCDCSVIQHSCCIKVSLEEEPLEKKPFWGDLYEETFTHI